MLVENDGAIQVKGGQALFPYMKKLLEDNEWSEATGRRALEVFQSNKGALEKTIQVAEAFLRS